ncbi:MAG: hypothetical protein JW976_03630 [Syntrophaceae bacterium]|nr:hypothetical protein [Syntrophaceae bacterium]
MKNIIVALLEGKKRHNYAIKVHLLLVLPIIKVYVAEKKEGILLHIKIQSKRRRESVLR